MPRASTSSRLSVDDWVEAALAVLAEEGPSGVKIDRLCVRLGVTKGSFYWHFADLDAFLGAVAERWAASRDARKATFADLEGEYEPRERLRRMMDVLSDPQEWPLERAVREWARSDGFVHDRVAASDRWVFGAIRKAFRELGFDTADADVRAKTLFYAGVGFIYAGPQGQRGGRRQRERVLEILTG